MSSPPAPPPPTQPQPQQPPTPQSPSPPAPTKITITTPRLLLRAARPTDADTLHAIFSNADVMRYWDTLPHTFPAQTAAWVEKMVASPANGVSEFVVCLSTSPGEAIGKIGIWRGTEIGFLLHRAYWRQGLMREAMEALLPYYFTPPLQKVDEEEGGGGRGRGIEVITADADPRNSACIELLTGFGFEVTGREERTFRVGVYGGAAEGGGPDGGEWVDSVHLALRREAWLERRRGTEERGG